jgi:hypothetical protein
LDENSSSKAKKNSENGEPDAGEKSGNHSSVIESPINEV